MPMLLFPRSSALGIDGLTDDPESLEYCLKIDAPLASLFLYPSLYHSIMAWQI